MTPKVPKALQKEWDKKLKDDGFDDIEFRDATGSCDSGFLKRHQLHTTRRIEENRDKEEYFQKAGWWVHDNAWRSRRNKRVFELHAEGHTLKNIQSLLTKPTSIANIHRIVTEEGAKLIPWYQEHGRGA